MNLIRTIVVFLSLKTLITNLFICPSRSNRKFSQFYTENLIDNTYKEIQAKKGNLDKIVQDDIWKILADEGAANCVKSFYQTASFGVRLLYTFQELIGRNNLLIEDSVILRPTTNELIEELERRMKILKTDDETFAFRSDSFFWFFFYKYMVMQKEFKLKNDEFDINWPDSEGILVFDLLLPFNNPNHNDGSCVAGKDLPRFYKYKGNPFYQ